MRCAVSVRFGVVVTLVLSAAVSPLRADESSPVKGTAEERTAVNMDESRVGDYVLPDPLAGPKGAVRSPAAWSERRAEILRQFEDHVYGRAPGTPDKLEFRVLAEQAALNDKAFYRKVAVSSRHEGRSHQFIIDLYLPRQASQRVPLFLLVNHRNTSTITPQRRPESGPTAAEYLVGRGMGVAEIQSGELAPDHPERYRNGVIGLFEEQDSAARPDHAWGAIAAWAWGARRALDYLQTDPAVDGSRIVLVGHSRGGKAALWAGALDKRFAMVIANNSGEGGAALARRNYGETIAVMTRSFPHWFAGRYRQYAGQEDALPVDQHMLLSLIAPRPLYVSSATEDRWADPRGEFLSLANASAVYGLWKEPAMDINAMPAPDTPLVVGRRGYHIRSGSHDLKVADWERFIDFAQRTWQSASGRTVSPKPRHPVG